MKTKTKSKKAAPKKTPKSDKGWKLVASKPKKAKEVKVEIVIRQLAPAETLPGRKHFVRVVNDTATSTLAFATIDEVNAYLFEFDCENHGLNPLDTGTWIDQIFTHVEGDMFDLDQLEPDQNS